ncbi:unnamed protein product [Urochloa decumbens]|uniref:Uncharacterized protein n=1 Tax=Urochloa decumbens TaxID=240449 RepID=A0ABC9CPF1_9POAL
MTDVRRRRGGSPDLSYGDPAGIDRNRRVILDTIYGYYKEALAALPLEDMPALVPRLLEAGVCFGFADPVTNIIANILFVLPEQNDEPARAEPGANGTNAREPGADGTKKRKRKDTSGSGEVRDELISKIVAGDGPSPPNTRTIAERSLEGMITFLISYFRYLHSWDALRYLSLARADLLVAVSLIQKDRCYRDKDEFCINSYAAKAALKYAALLARHPDVNEFCACSFALVPHINLIAQTVQAHRSCPMSFQEIHSLSGLLKTEPKIKKSGNPIEFAAQRFDYSHNNVRTEKVPGGLTISLQAVLLDRIHAQYLKVFSLLPMRDIRNRHHRGLIKAGYCYGPFSPATNIIVNAVWYDTAFPAPEEFEVDMICTPAFMRVESRSLVGLIKLLLSCIPEISEHEAMVYLLKSSLKVRKAIRMARNEGWHTSGWDVSAYTAATDASVHPEPEAYLEFVTQFLPSVRSTVKTLLIHSDIRYSKVYQLSMLFSTSNFKPAKPLGEIVELSKDALEMFQPFKEKFISQQSFLRKRIEAILSSKGYLYELQVICVANFQVGEQIGCVDFKCPYSHVNFFASSSDRIGVELFFAEFSNDEDEKSFCCIVSNQSIHQVRCCYCEYQGTRIVHPAENYYCGGATDFATMACGDHYINNARIISGGNCADSRVNMSGEDYIYFDPTRDTKFIKCMNQSALRANANWGDISRIAETYVF